MAKSKEELAAYQRAYRLRRKAEGRPITDEGCERKRKNNLAKKYRTYGIDEAEFQRMYSDQSGRCAICASPILFENLARSRRDNANIDHCHVTGKVRGLLCSNCNVGLGNFKDSVTSLEAAIRYLLKP